LGPTLLAVGYSVVQEWATIQETAPAGVEAAASSERQENSIT
jgi:hypothetical protein